jgi:hypothetical protein
VHYLGKAAAHNVLVALSNFDCLQDLADHKKQFHLAMHSVVIGVTRVKSVSSISENHGRYLLPLQHAENNRYRASKVLYSQ